MPTDAEFYRYMHQMDCDDLCVTCREDMADPDDPEGKCNWCGGENDE